MLKWETFPYYIFIYLNEKEPFFLAVCQQPHNSTNTPIEKVQKEMLFHLTVFIFFKIYFKYFKCTVKTIIYQYLKNIFHAWVGKNLKKIKKKKKYTEETSNAKCLIS